MTADETALVAFANLARDLSAQTSEQDVLDRVVELAVQFIDGCDDAGILLLHRRRDVETAATSSELVRESDQAQAELREGPCFDAALDDVPWNNRVYRSKDTATETRWPSYMPRARDLGIGSMLGFQLYRDEGSFGALDLYSHRRNAFDDRAEDLGWVLASHAAVALNSARTDEQLRTALTTREEIGKALGILMERHQLSDDAAFTVLKRISQDNNLKLRAVAETLLRTGELPGEGPRERG
ncbi:response regulator receiver and ANTAR domain protein [Halopolyspora algeriensis]|uniref:Response regulator receiver and ANTAR domain protein n=1 Tax=Halopolyspora algeriensis TaxID=1500506 RepID=A0A368VHI7_9ACTN|nr:GAF and ANTAR domain-containing protein [Halopolyspora algeriensis]RCW40718.1 response regulator receiver and ANTAR domain protein [Halopolyspora algeriensis]TQM53359.1 response regulator receiver and ANTAR domain protein [Halopolyspora algeriensis]